jgi:ribosomal protein S18 acetylase RimI-like enzyme
MARAVLGLPHTGGGTLEILDLRHFTSADLRPLLQAETEYWGRHLDWDYQASAEMILRYIDAKILPGYAAVADGRVQGYTFYVYEGAKGVIGDLFVLPETEDGEGLERRLLAHVVETLQNSPGIHRIEAQLLAHSSGAVAAPFLREGFLRYPRLFMLVPLSRATIVPTRQDGIQIRRWQESDFHEGASVITEAYREHVDAEINDQYRTDSGSMRFLNNIIRFPGCGTFDGQGSFVAVDRHGGQILGLILSSRVKEDVGHITQVCILPDRRSRGVGQALIAASVAEMKRRRFSALSLTVTEANFRAVELYRRLGFETKHVFDAFVWEG